MPFFLVGLRKIGAQKGVSIAYKFLFEIDAQLGVIVAYASSANLNFLTPVNFTQFPAKVHQSLKSGFHTRVDNRMNVEIGKIPKSFEL